MLIQSRYASVKFKKFGVNIINKQKVVRRMKPDLESLQSSEIKRPSHMSTERIG